MQWVHHPFSGCSALVKAHDMANENHLETAEDDVLFEEEIYQEWVSTDLELQYPLLTRISAEGFGALLLTFLGFGLSLFPSIVGLNDAFLWVLGYGIAAIAAFAAVARVSGGHFNPAITLGAAAAGRLKWSLVLPYIGAQILGALVGGGLIFLLINSIPSVAGDVRSIYQNFIAGWGDTVSYVGANALTAALIEVILAAILVGVFLGVTAKRVKTSAAPFIIGGLLATLFIFAMPFTGSRINPALATAAAAFADGSALTQVWLFWVAALFGGLLAGLVYTAFSSETLTATEPFILDDGDFGADHLDEYEEFDEEEDPEEDEANEDDLDEDSDSAK